MARLQLFADVGVAHVHRAIRRLRAKTRAVARQGRDLGRLHQSRHDRLLLDHVPVPTGRLVESWTTAIARTVTVKVLGTSGRPRVDVDGFVTAR